MKTIEHLLNVLQISTYFGIPGGAIGPFCDLIHHSPKVENVYARHETGAVFMACGHWMTTKKLPGVFVTSGPGFTNALTGIASAKADGIPMVIIVGEVPTTKFGKKGLQEGTGMNGTLSVVEMASSVTKKAVQLKKEDLYRDKLTALLMSLQSEALAIPAGPVLLSLPLDLSTDELGEFPFNPNILEPLSRAQNPVVVLGSGASGCKGLLSFLQDLNVPVITSPKAKGILPDDFPLNKGIFGYGGHPSAMKLLEKGVDVGLFLGCGLSEVSTNGWSPLLQPAHMIHVNPVPTSNYRVDHWVGCTVSEFIQYQRVVPHPGVVEAGIERVPFSSPKFNHLDVINLLQEGFKDVPVTWTSDIGEHLLFVLHYLKCKANDQFQSLLTFGSMGSGIGVALGAAIANKNQRVVCFVGDYGFQMAGQDLATAVAHGAGNLVIVVFNDQKMTMVKNGQEKIFKRSYDCLGGLIDFAGIANAQGAKGLVVHSLEQLQTMLPAIVNRHGAQPIVLDVRIEHHVFSNNARSSSLGGFAK